MLEALPGLLEQGGQLALRARAIRCCRKVSLRRQRNTPVRWAFRLAITKHFRIALWAARTSFWCPAVLNRGDELYGLYGTLPLVRRRWLADTVSDCSLDTLQMASPVGLSSAMLVAVTGDRRAFVPWSGFFTVAVREDQAMAMDFSWQVAAKSYRELLLSLK